MFTTRVLYDALRSKIFQTAFFVLIPFCCLKSDRAMVSSGLIANLRPVSFLSLRFNCLIKNLTFVSMLLYTVMVVFIQTGGLRHLFVFYMKIGGLGSFVIQSTETIKRYIAKQGELDAGQTTKLFD